MATFLKWSIIIVTNQPFSKPYNVSTKIKTILIIIIILSAGGILCASIKITQCFLNTFSLTIEKNRYESLFESQSTLNQSINVYVANSNGYRNFVQINTLGDFQERCESSSRNNYVQKVAFQRSKDDHESKESIRRILQPHIQSIDNKRDGYDLTEEPLFICPALGRITSHFGIRSDPVFEGTALHKGIDIANSEGSEVVAAAEGLVVYAGMRPLWGNVVIIQHFKSNYQTTYAHLKSIRVHCNDTVFQRQVIGFIGNTGKSTGPHLHYEIRFLSESVDPLTYILPKDTIAE